MTKPRDPEALLSAYLVEGMEVLPDRVADAVLDEVHRTHQRAGFGSWRTRLMSRTTLAAAVVVAVVATGGAFFVIQRGQPAFGGPEASASASASASQPAVAVPSATPTPSAAPSPSQDPPSLELTWSKVALVGRETAVAWLGDRFVLVDTESGEVSTSTDGVSWQAPDADPGYLELLRGEFVISGSDVVGWWNPQEAAQCGSCTNQPPITARDVVQIVRPPAAPTSTTPFKGRIESIGIGPMGVVAQVHSDLDWDAWVTKKLGVRTNNAWVEHLKSIDFEDGILQIKLDNGPGLKVVWADEGFQPGDYQDAGFGWYSPDGEQWTAMPFVGSPGSDGFLGFPTGFGDVVGVSDGFIARGPEGMWHSSDGLTWRNLGSPPADSSSDGSVLVPWMGGALSSDGVGRFDFWTSQGLTELPMAADVRAASKQPNEPRDNAIGTGPFGAAFVSIDNQEILVTRDGIDWEIQPMPAEMAADYGGIYGGRRSSTVAVGERSVLVLLWAGDYTADQVPSLWLGTPEP